MVMTSNDNPWRGGGSLTLMVFYCIISIQILSAPRSHAATIRIAGELRALFSVHFFCLAVLKSQPNFVYCRSEHDFITFLSLQVPSNIQKAIVFICERLHSDLEQNKKIAHILTLHARTFKTDDDHYSEYKVITFCGRGRTNCLGHVALVNELVKRWYERKTKLKSS
ncbi:hypothetical protein LOK49_LG04G00400 [Camellia lanceoleosa]|uniref:Uncharacterized protein n=1 Tax=Camellia lanceoleosa TaxID=1840588 RepID=A0ACC0HYD4_9ERIC|nr:hypothetical protein LOK49_LG04G00400 [Camellia lanceoleosa]